MDKTFLKIFKAPPHQQSSHSHLYVYDVSHKRETFLSPLRPNQSAVYINNITNDTYRHYCIDGKLIDPSDHWFYLGTERFFERCDSLLYTDSLIYFIEFKLNTQETTSDTNRWQEYSKGLRQIISIFRYLTLMGNDFGKLCKTKQVIAYIAIPKAPNFDSRRNSQRLTELEKFHDLTGMRVLRPGKTHPFDIYKP